MKAELTDHMTDKKVLVVGELLADLISEENISSLASPSRFLMSQGGSSANLCANLKWLGVDTELIGCVGSDNLGTFLINEIRTTGLSDRYLSRSNGHQTSMVLVGKNTETPDFIAYRSADMQIGKIEDALIESCAIIHTTAFALSNAPARDNILDAFARAAKMGKQVSVDWNYAPSIWNGDPGRAVFNAICKFSPLLKISLDDIERYTAKTLTIEESKAELDQLQANAICLTCGKDGVWFKAKNGAWQHKAALPVNTVSGVTGAGDAFWSGFLADFIKGKSLEDCVDKALAIARKKIEQAGPLYKN